MSADDLDRTAILARRQRFIAIALSSLAGVACTSRAGKPQVCLSPPMPETQGEPKPPIEEPPIEEPPVEEPPVEEPPVEEPPTEAPPQPCLKVAKPK